jgi:hypothetical protein
MLVDDWILHGMQEVREFDSPRLHQNSPDQVVKEQVAASLDGEVRKR